ncbi:hypothetical protein YTPLAS18_13760 [Nitrospira sp.]|nr:hypothetical protein YTPLAS18_13760 [Nitrospira sp.]
MENTIRLDLEGSFLDLRRHPRVRVDAPFTCAVARKGIRSWWSSDNRSLGVVFDVSMNGAKVLTESPVRPGERMSLTLNLPRQAAPTQVEVAAARWVAGPTMGVEFLSLSPESEWRLRKFLSQAIKSSSLSPSSISIT